MKQYKAISAALLLSFSVALSGCVTATPPKANMSPTEAALRQKQTENVRIVQGVATGAAIGAVLGGGLALIASGGDKKAMLRGAGVGALAGGVMGGVDANNVNQKTRAEAAQQDQLKAVIANANKNIAHYKSMANMTAKLASEERSNISRLNKSYQNGELDVAGYRSQLGYARENLRIVDGQISDVDRDINDLQKYSPGNTQVAAKVASLKSTKASLVRQRENLASSYSRVPSEINSRLGS